MDLTKINLNYYSFGYLGGFVDKSIKKMTIKELSQLADSLDFGGIEFPVDYLFCDKYLDLDNYLKNNKGLNIFISFENFNVKVLKLIIPILKRNGIHKARIKMSNYFGGNRYKMIDFQKILEEFTNDLNRLKFFLLDHEFQLLIENHQDLNSHDILKIINAISEKCIGINWDVGNSLPTGETPAQFYENIKDHIYNIHIKDYKTIRNKNAMEYHRCIIGEGNIGLNDILRLLIQEDYNGMMSLELGAYTKRVSYVFKEEYWAAYPCYQDNHKLKYFDFVNSKIKSSVNFDKIKTPTKESELFQIEQSTQNLRDLN